VKAGPGDQRSPPVSCAAPPVAGVEERQALRLEGLEPLQGRHGVEGVRGPLWGRATEGRGGGAAGGSGGTVWVRGGGPASLSRALTKSDGRERINEIRGIDPHA